MESLYWVFTLKCNDFCDHCYNDSGPKGETITTNELLKVIPNLPHDLNRIILSGGEPTVEMNKLETLVLGLRKKYKNKTQIYLQSNGDLLDEKKMNCILEMTVDRLDIVSIDRYHKKKGEHKSRLKTLFDSFGMRESGDPETSKTHQEKGAQYAFWGATEDLWLGGNWARGRALPNKAAKLDPHHNFCNRWSGAIGFLEDGKPEQEVHIQLYRLYPCCPTTYYSLGDVRLESVENLLEKYRKLPTFKTLNQGDVHSLGTEIGLTKKFIQQRIQALGDVCLWCDEYFQKYYEGPKGEARRSVSP